MDRWAEPTAASRRPLPANPRLPRILRISANVALAFLLASLAAWSAPPPALVHVHNLGEVNASLLRGAEPSPVAMQELQAHGVKLIIDLRESGQATFHEQQLARQLGMQYVNVPFPPLSAPSREELRTVLLLLMNRGNTPVFVHCRRGRDRTGTVVACYRMQHDGWNNARALQEANEFGMSRMQRSMRSFIMHFSPLADTVLYPTNAAVSRP